MATRKELIEKLKQDKQYPFSMLKIEEQEILQEVGIERCQFFDEFSGWRPTIFGKFYDSVPYRISPDYQEPDAEPRYEICEVEFTDCGYYFICGETGHSLDTALKGRFAGCQFENQCGDTWYMFPHGWIDDGGEIYYEMMEHDGVKLATPKRVRFLKGE